MDNLLSSQKTENPLYKEMVQHANAFLIECNAQAVLPSAVTQKIVLALESKDPKTRHVVNGRAAIMARRLLSDRMYDDAIKQRMRDAYRKHGASSRV
jgi:hypothetical protein